MRSLTLLCCCLSVEGLDKLLEISLEALADFGMLEGNFAVCLHDAELVAHVVTDSVEIISNEIASCAELAHDVGQIKLLAGLNSSQSLFEHTEHLGRENDSAEDSIVRHDLLGSGLLDDLVAAHCASLKRSDVERAVHRNKLVGNFLDADNALAVLLICSAQLSSYRIVADGDIVAVENGERLVADEALAAEDSMAETLGLLLADEIYVCKVCNCLDLFVDLLFVLLAGRFASSSKEWSK